MARASDSVRSPAVLAAVLAVMVGPLACKEPRPHAINAGAGGTLQAAGGATGTGGNGTGAGGASTGGSVATGGRGSGGGSSGAGGRGSGGSNSGGAGTGTGGAATGGAPGSGGGGGLTSSGGAPGTGGSLSCNPACPDGARCNAGTCVCISDGVTLCTDACVNLQLDPTHCGSCTNMCSGGCSIGRCFTEVTKSLYTRHMAVNDNFVFFTSYEAGTVSFVSRTGANLRVSAASQAGPLAIAIDSTNAYWVNQGGDTSATPPPSSVVKMPLYGGMPVTLASSPPYGNGPQHIAVDATNVYWDIVGTTTSIMKVPIAGGDAVTLASGATWVNISGMALDGTNVYWASGGASANTGSIMKVSVAGGTPTTVASNLNSPGLIGLVNGTIYFTTAEAGTVRTVTTTGGTVSSIPVTAIGNAMAVDGSGMFFAGWDPSIAALTVSQVSLDGKTTTELTHPIQTVTQLVLDAGNVFWNSAADIGFTAKAP